MSEEKLEEKVKEEPKKDGKDSKPVYKQVYIPPPPARHGGPGVGRVPARYRR